MGRPVGVRELKNELSAVLRRVSEGEAVVVTDRKRPVALVVPLREGADGAVVRQLVKAGRLAWSGGKPAGARNAPRITGPSVADAVLEDRR